MSEFELINNLTTVILFLQSVLITALFMQSFVDSKKNCIQIVLHYSGIVLTIFNFSWINLIW